MAGSYFRREQMDIRKWAAPVAAVAVLGTLAGCNSVLASMTTGSGQPETRQFNLADFTRIQASHAFELKVNRAGSYSVLVTADDNLWDVMDITQTGGTLRLQVKPGVGVQNATLKAEVTLPSITGLDLSGASRASIDGFDSGNAMAFHLSGASVAKVTDMKAGRTDFDLSGASSLSGSMTAGDAEFVVSGAAVVMLEGSGTAGRINASGAGRVDLGEFQLQSVSVRLSGGATANVAAGKIDPADLSGGSHLYYAGDPTIGGLTTSGGASISRK
jgi:hypothetical protein